MARTKVKRPRRRKKSRFNIRFPNALFMAILPWAISLGSLLIVFLILLWGQLAFTGLYYARLQEDFSVRVLDKHKLESLLRDRRYAPLLASHEDVTHILVAVVAHVDRGELQEALQLLEEKSKISDVLLKQIHERLMDLLEEDAHLQKSITNAELQSEVESQSHLASVLEMKTSLSRILSELAKLSLSPLLIESYNQLGELAHHFGYSLPKLRLV